MPYRAKRNFRFDPGRGRGLPTPSRFLFIHCWRAYMQLETAMPSQAYRTSPEQLETPDFRGPYVRCPIRQPVGRRHSLGAVLGKRMLSHYGQVTAVRGTGVEGLSEAVRRLVSSCHSLILSPMSSSTRDTRRAVLGSPFHKSSDQVSGGRFYLVAMFVNN